MADNFFSFEDALKELRLKEEELKRLVSEGEIRAFRDGDTMKLRKADVETLRSELSGGEVVDLGDVSEELVFEDDADLEDEAGMATEEISDVDTIIEEDVEDVGELDLEEEDDELAAAPAVRRTSARAMAAEESETEPVWVTAACVVVTLIMMAALPVTVAISTGNVNTFAQAIASPFAGGKL